MERECAPASTKYCSSSSSAVFDHGDEETMAVLESSVGSYVVVVECSNVGGLTFQAIVQGIAYLAN